MMFLGWVPETTSMRPHPILLDLEFGVGEIGDNALDGEVRIVRKLID